MKVTEIKELLDRHQIQLTKSLGQNFLHDGNQLQKIADAADLRPEDKVLEIGPGLGPLTGALLEKGVHVFAIEKDARLIPILKQRLGHNPNLRIHHGDALDYLKDKQHDWTDWKMISNLPYSVASPILVELAESPFAPKMIVATLQLEVIHRVKAPHGDKTYGLLSLLLQYKYQPTSWFKIPPACFHPSPDVDSGCITLTRREGDLLSPAEERNFKILIKTSFSQRRKMMFKLLKGSFPEPALFEAFRITGLDLKIRAEQVSLVQFKTMVRELTNPGASGPKPGAVL